MSVESKIIRSKKHLQDINTPFNLISESVARGLKLLARKPVKATIIKVSIPTQRQGCVYVCLYKGRNIPVDN